MSVHPFTGQREGAPTRLGGILCNLSPGMGYPGEE